MIIANNFAFAYPINLVGGSFSFNTSTGFGISLPPLPPAPDLVPQYPYQQTLPIKFQIPYSYPDRLAIWLEASNNSESSFLIHEINDKNPNFIDYGIDIDFINAVSDPFTNVNQLDISFLTQFWTRQNNEPNNSKVAFSLIDYTDPNNPTIFYYDELSLNNEGSSNTRHIGTPQPGTWNYNIRLYRRDYELMGNYLSTVTLDPMRTYLLGIGSYTAGIAKEGAGITNLAYIYDYKFEARSPAPVPEPASIFLLGTGLCALFGLKRKKKA